MAPEKEPSRRINRVSMRELVSSGQVSEWIRKGFVAQTGQTPHEPASSQAYAFTESGLLYRTFRRELAIQGAQDQAEGRVRGPYIPSSQSVTSARRDLVLHLAQQGLSSPSVAELVGITPRTAKNDFDYLIHSHSLDPQLPTQRRNNEINAAIVEGALTRKPLATLAEELGISAAAVKDRRLRLREKGELPDTLPLDMTIGEAATLEGGIVIDGDVSDVQSTDEDLPDLSIETTILAHGGLLVDDEPRDIVEIPLDESVGAQIHLGDVPREHADIRRIPNLTDRDNILVQLYGSVPNPELEELFGISEEAIRTAISRAKKREPLVAVTRKNPIPISLEYKDKLVAAEKERQKTVRESTEAFEDAVRTRHERGESMEQISARFGVTNTTVFRREHGIVPMITEPSEGRDLAQADSETVDDVTDLAFDVGQEDATRDQGWEQPDMQERRGYRGTTEEYD